MTGQLNPGLSPTGVQQSRALAAFLADQDLAAIYTSALQRTIDTAQPTATAKHLSIEALAALNEIGMGVLEGRYRDERDPQAQAIWEQWRADVWQSSVPGGERFEQLAERVGQVLQTIVQRHQGQSVLMVGHRATNRVLLGSLLRWPPKQWSQLRLPNKYLYRVRLGAEPAVATITLSGSKAGLCTDGLLN